MLLQGLLVSEEPEKITPNQGAQHYVKLVAIN